MKALFFKQPKPSKIKILAVLILLLDGYLLFKSYSTVSQILILLTIAIVLLGYSFSYEIRKNFDVFRHFTFFGITIYKVKENLTFPEYISVFSALFKHDNEWGAVSALGTQEKHSFYVIRLFNGNNKFTLFKTNNYENAISRANELSELIGVEVYDATNS